VLILSKNTSKINKPNNSDVNELLNNNNEVEKHKSVSREENKKLKDK
jgi:hypothetical protein